MWRGLVTVARATILADAVPKVVGALVSFLVAKFMLPGNYLQWSRCLVLVGGVWSLADLGLNGYAIRAIARASLEDRVDLMLEIRYAYMYLSMAATIGAMIFGLLVKAHPAFYGMLLYIPLYALVPDWSYRGSGNFRMLAAVNWSICFGQIIAALVVALLDSLVMPAIVWGIAPCWALIVIIFDGSWPRYYNPLSRFVFSRSMAHVRTSVVFAANGILGGAVVAMAVHSITLIQDREKAVGLVIVYRATLMASGFIWQFYQNFMHRLVAKGTELLEHLVKLGVAASVVSGLSSMGIYIGTLLLSPKVLNDKIGPLFPLALLLIWQAKFICEMLLLLRCKDYRRSLINLALVVAMLMSLSVFRDRMIAILLAEAFALCVAILLSIRMFNYSRV